MQEFTSISVSSYEADTLAALLNEKSGDGWDVVAIVPTGSTVTAYLSKDKAADSAGSKPTDSEEVEPAAGIAAAAAADSSKESDTVADKPTVDPVTVGATAAVLTAAKDDNDEASATTTPIDEPAGWAAGTGAATGATAASTTPAATTSSAAATPAAAAATPAATAAAAPSAAAAPAGWYADPSSRYELRYWDGSQWTEHVSRAGQQFTDPPVA